MDYCTMALESLLKDQKVQCMMEAQNLVEESNFITECISSGYISLENFKYTPVTEGFADSLMEFINKIVAHFKTKAVERSKKYIPWLKECGDQIKERAAKTEALKLSPLWQGNWADDGKKINTKLTEAFSNYDRGSYTNYGFTKDFLDKETILTEDGTAALTDSLKQYFRYGVKQSKPLDTVTVDGTKLAGMIDDILDYLINFESKALKNVTAINDNIARSLKNVKTFDQKDQLNVKPTDEPATEKKPVQDSFTPNTWLSIEERPVSESMLTLMANYKVLTEADGDPNKDKDKTEPVTKATPAEEPKQDDQKDVGGNKKGNDEASKYLENVKTFAKLAVSAYQTVLDERYILYINICKSIGDNSGSGPKFDKNGKYISKTKKPAEDTTKVEK